MNWKDLSGRQITEFEEFFYKFFKCTYSTRCETGEPMFFDEDKNLYPNEFLIEHWLKLTREEKLKRILK